MLLMMKRLNLSHLLAKIIAFTRLLCKADFSAMVLLKFEFDNSLMERTVLCTVGDLTASQSFIHWPHYESSLTMNAGPGRVSSLVL